MIVLTEDTGDQERTEDQLAVLAECHRIWAACKRDEDFSLSFPDGAEYLWTVWEEAPEGGADAAVSACGDEYAGVGRLLGFLAAFEMDEDSLECCAFVRPWARRRGAFRELLAAACDSPELTDRDFYFAVDEDCLNAKKALAAVGAEESFAELMMERELTESESVSSLPDRFPPLALRALEDEETEEEDGDLEEETDEEDGDGEWLILLEPESPSENSSLLGSCRLSLRGEDAYLYGLEIAPELRGRGLGYWFLKRLLAGLADDGFGRLSLQVSGENTAALSLYKKTGFRVAQTLSFYLY